MKRKDVIFVSEREAENEDEEERDKKEGKEYEYLEDSIPDLPENQAIREFLKKAPTKGLHMPLGKEVKVMQCWRCKAYGHRSGDRECPLRVLGNLEIENERIFREDPMNRYMIEFDNEMEEKLRRVERLKELLEEVREEERERKRRKKEKKEKKERKKLRKEEKKREKKRKSSAKSYQDP